MAHASSTSTVPTPPVGTRRPVVFLGDSITQFWSRYRPSFFRLNCFINRGVGGETTRQVRLRFAHDVQASGAVGVHLMAGLNDIAGNEGPLSMSATQDNLAAMIADAQALGLPVLVGAITPAATIAWNPEVRPVEPILALNAWLRDHCAARGAEFLDYHALLRDAAGGLKDGLGPDGSHLHAPGYRLIEPLLLGAVARRFGPPTPMPFWERWLPSFIRAGERPV